jgi:hypothetical protein
MGAREPDPVRLGTSQALLPFSRFAIAERASRFLPAGVEIRHIVRGQIFSPWWRLIPILGNFYISPVQGYRIVAVTDDAMYVLAATYWFRWQPKRLVTTLPRETRFGPLRGPATRLTLGAEAFWLFWRFYVDARASDEELDEQSRAHR